MSSCRHVPKKFKMQHPSPFPRCPYCRQLFGNNSDLDVHSRWCDGKKHELPPMNPPRKKTHRMICGRCSMKFFDGELYAEHKSVCGKEEP